MEGLLKGGGVLPVDAGHRRTGAAVGLAAQRALGAGNRIRGEDAAGSAVDVIVEDASIGDGAVQDVPGAALRDVRGAKSAI